MLVISLISGIYVAVWGFPSHFGADPTCFVFRGTFDTSCWTDAFKPTIRAFSTLGQPAWLAAYMAFLLPISTAYALKNKRKKATFVTLLLITLLFYLLLLFSDTSAGTIGFWVGNALLWAAIYFKKIYPKKEFFKTLVIINALFILSTVLFGHSFDSLKEYLSTKPAAPTTTQTHNAPQPSAKITTQDITNSGTIRLLVWKGALNAWKNNPLFGTGVETFAFAYYK